MDNKVDIAAIGASDSVLLFNSVGFRTFVAKSTSEVEKTIFQLVNQKCKIVFIDEEIYVKIPETIKNYQSSLFPILIPISMNEGSSQIGLKKIQENVEKAIGINIF